MPQVSPALLGCRLVVHRCRLGVVHAARFSYTLSRSVLSRRRRTSQHTTGGKDQLRPTSSIPIGRRELEAGHAVRHQYHRLRDVVICSVHEEDGHHGSRSEKKNICYAQLFPENDLSLAVGVDLLHTLFPPRISCLKNACIQALVFVVLSALLHVLGISSLLSCQLPHALFLLATAATR